MKRLPRSPNRISLNATTVLQLCHVARCEIARSESLYAMNVYHSSADQSRSHPCKRQQHSTVYPNFFSISTALLVATTFRVSKLLGQRLGFMYLCTTIGIRMCSHMPIRLACAKLGVLYRICMPPSYQSAIVGSSRVQHVAMAQLVVRMFNLLFYFFCFDV